MFSHLPSLFDFISATGSHLIGESCVGCVMCLFALLGSGAGFCGCAAVNIYVGTYLVARGVQAQFPAILRQIRSPRKLFGLEGDRIRGVLGTGHSHFFLQRFDRGNTELGIVPAEPTYSPDVHILILRL